MKNTNLDEFYVGVLEGQRLFESILQDILLLIPLLLFLGINSRQFRIWWRKYRRRNAKQQEHYRSLAQKSKTEDDTEENREARRELTKIVRKNILVMSISTSAVILAWFVLDDLIDKIHLDGRNSTEKILVIWDTQLARAYRRSTSLEQLLGSTASEDVNPDKTSEEDLKRRIQREVDALKENKKRFRDQTLCSKKFEEYVVEKRYDGYDEIDVLIGAINRYDACMLENGWYTETCSKKDNEGNCNELTYSEPSCVTKLREWMMAGKSKWNSRPCPGYTWNWKRYRERLHK